MRRATDTVEEILTPASAAVAVGRELLRRRTARIITGIHEIQDVSRESPVIPVMTAIPHQETHTTEIATRHLQLEATPWSLEKVERDDHIVTSQNIDLDAIWHRRQHHPI